MVPRSQLLSTYPGHAVSWISQQVQRRDAVVLLEVVPVWNVLLLVRRQVRMC